MHAFHLLRAAPLRTIPSSVAMTNCWSGENVPSRCSPSGSCPVSWLRLASKWNRRLRSGAVGTAAAKSSRPPVS